MTSLFSGSSYVILGVSGYIICNQKASLAPWPNASLSDDLSDPLPVAWSPPIARHFWVLCSVRLPKVRPTYLRNAWGWCYDSYRRPRRVPWAPGHLPTAAALGWIPTFRVPMPQFQTLLGLQTLDSGEQMSTCHADPCRHVMPGLHLTFFQGSRQRRSQILQWLIVPGANGYQRWTE